MSDILRTATIEADPVLPVIRIARDFRATVGQLFRAHTDPALFVRWVGPDGLTTTVDRWDATTGGNWRYVAARRDGGVEDGLQFAFHGSFHEVRPDRIVQTFTWEGEPEAVALQTLEFVDLGDGRTRLRTQSLCDSLETRDGWLRSGMRLGVDQGYAKLDALLTSTPTTHPTTSTRPTPTTDGADA